MHPERTNLGLRPFRAMFPKGVCLPQNPRALSPVRDCLGFVIAGPVKSIHPGKARQRLTLHEVIIGDVRPVTVFWRLAGVQSQPDQPHV